MRGVMGLAQAEVAARTGIDRWRLSRWETGYLELTPDELQVFSDFIHQVSLARSEAGTLPQADDVSADSRQRGRSFRQQRLSWAIRQKDVAEAAGLPDNLVSMWENAYCEMEEEEIQRLTAALTTLIDKQSSQLEWWQNPAELERRREALGVSRKRLARHCGQSEKWVSDLEGGHVPITPEISNKIWEYLATLEAEQGRTTELKAALTAPEPASEMLPYPLGSKSKLRAIIAQQKKVIEIVKQQHKNAEEANVLLSHIVRELELQVAAAQKIAVTSADGKQLAAIIGRCFDIINE
jgi:predicted transcriptional regulator